MTLDLPGELQGRYRVRRVLGQGGFGTVLLVEDLELARPVALKLLSARLEGDEHRARFAREARVTAALQHPAVVPVYDFGVTGDGTAWIAYAFVEGTDLAARVASQGPLAPERVVALGQALASALSAAHRAGVLHRDVKPANVLLPTLGGPLLCDFGIARRATGDTVATATGLILGTPDFMAPEVLLGAPASPASDQYSLAATLFLAALGRPPIESQDLAGLVRAARARSLPRLPEGLPATERALAQRLLPGLAPDPGQRYPDLEALARALDAAPSDAVATLALSRASLPGAGPATRALPAPGSSRGRKAAALVATLGLLAGLLGRGRPAAPPATPTPSREVPAPPREVATSEATLLEARLQVLEQMLEDGPHALRRVLDNRLAYRARALRPALASGELQAAVRDLLTALGDWLDEVRRTPGDDAGTRWLTPRARELLGPRLAHALATTYASLRRLRDLDLAEDTAAALSNHPRLEALEQLLTGFWAERTEPPRRPPAALVASLVGALTELPAASHEALARALDERLAEPQPEPEFTHLLETRLRLARGRILEISLVTGGGPRCTRTREEIRPLVASMARWRRRLGPDSLPTALTGTLSLAAVAAQRCPEAARDPVLEALLLELARAVRAAPDQVAGRHVADLYQSLRSYRHETRAGTPAQVSIQRAAEATMVALAAARGPSPAPGTPVPEFLRSPLARARVCLESLEPRVPRLAPLPEGEGRARLLAAAADLHGADLFGRVEDLLEALVQLAAVQSTDRTETRVQAVWDLWRRASGCLDAYLANLRHLRSLLATTDPAAAHVILRLHALEVLAEDGWRQLRSLPRRPLESLLLEARASRNLGNFQELSLLERLRRASLADRDPAALSEVLDLWSQLLSRHLGNPADPGRCPQVDEELGMLVQVVELRAPLLGTAPTRDAALSAHEAGMKLLFDCPEIGSGGLSGRIDVLLAENPVGSP